MKLLYVQAIILVINNMVNFQSYQLSILLNVALMSLAVICCLGQPRKTRGVARPLAVAGEKNTKAQASTRSYDASACGCRAQKPVARFAAPQGAQAVSRARPLFRSAQRAREPKKKKKKKRRGNHRLRCWVVAFLPFGAQLRTNPHHARACAWWHTGMHMVAGGNRGKENARLSQTRLSTLARGERCWRGGGLRV